MMKMDSNTTLQLHVATQYLAAAGKNYVAPKDDDSHTNAGWDATTSSFFTRSFSNSDSLVFFTKEMRLAWNGNKPGSFSLKGHTHVDVLKWLEETSLQNGLKKFVFDLHYTLGSGEILNDFSFDGAQEDALGTHAGYRTFADNACKEVLSKLGMTAEVRTWPHHFDTGAYVMVPGSKISTGFGLAIPDSLSKDYYLYTSGYVDGDSMPTASLPALPLGKWLSEDWQGGILSVDGLKEPDYLKFLETAIEAVKSFTPNS
jgi:hypothetical protein